MKRYVRTLLSLVLITTLLIPSMPKLSALGPNLIKNSSFESTNPVDASSPQFWSKSKIGNSKATFTYSPTGYSGSRSAYVKTAAYSSGEAKWVFDPIDVTPNTTYTFSDYYMSNTTSETVVQVEDINGIITKQWQKTIASSTTWKQNTLTYTTPATAKKITVFHLLQKNGWLQIDDTYFGVTAATEVTAPSVVVTAPTSNTTVSNTVNITASATDAVGIAGVQFKVNGVNLGNEDTTAPYVTPWDTTSYPNTTNGITAVARNTSELTTKSSTINVTVSNPITPTVDEDNLILNPSMEISVNGTPDKWLSNFWGTSSTSFTYDNNGRTGSRSVKTTVSTYSNGDAKWYFQPVAITANKNYLYRDYYKSTTTTRVVAAFIDVNGAYTYRDMGAVPATNNWSLYETTIAMPATAVRVTVFHVIESVGSLSIDDVLLQVAVTAPADINIPNGSLELGTTTPLYWRTSNWGVNSPTFTYMNEGHTGSKSIKVTVNNYSSGDAKWFFEPIKTLTPGQQYRFSTWYKGNVPAHVVALYINASGVEQYVGLPSPLTTSAMTWQKYSDTFTVPVGATQVSLFMFAQNNGWLQTDDYSITTYHPEGFSRPLLSMTFDDGHEVNTTNALPLLNSYGFKSTQCFATSFIEGQTQTVKNGVLAFLNSGHEICSHTVTHPFLTTLTTTNLDYELAHSKSYLESLTGKPVLNFASPYGDYDSVVNTAIAKYYQLHRTVDEGFNSKDNFDPYRLRVQNILDTTSATQVQQWIEQAKTDNTWLILVYHRIANNPGPYDSYINVFSDHLRVISQSGIQVRTMQDASTEVRSQL